MTHFLHRRTATHTARIGSAFGVLFTCLAASAATDNSAAGLSPDVLVNGQPISQNHVAMLSSSFAGSGDGKSLDAADARSAARTELITEELLAQQARKAHLDQKPAVADQLAFQQREVLSRAYLEDYFAHNPITDASLKSAYEFDRANGKIVEYHVRQILVQTSEQATALIARLDKGEDFATLAHGFSLDPGGQNNGGDLGWFRPDIFVDHTFSDAVVALKKTEYTHAPVRTRFGWHVIKVEDGPRRVANPEPYDALADNVKQALRQRAAQAQIENLTARLTAEAHISAPAGSSGGSAGGVARSSR